MDELDAGTPSVQKAKNYVSEKDSQPKTKDNFSTKGLKPLESRRREVPDDGEDPCDFWCEVNGLAPLPMTGDQWSTSRLQYEK